MDGETAVANAYRELGADAEPGAFARSIRTSLGLSLKEVASRVGNDTHFTTIAKLETGKMNFTYDWSRELGRALGVPASVFFMPYDVLNEAKRIPVYTSLGDAMNRADTAPNHYTSMSTSKDELFGVSVLGAPDLVADIVMHTLIFDPSDTKLKEGGVFLISDSRAPEGIIGLHRKKEDVQAIIPWPAPRELIHFLDPTTVTVFGRAVEVQRPLVSRNS